LFSFHFSFFLHSTLHFLNSCSFHLSLSLFLSILFFLILISFLSFLSFCLLFPPSCPPSLRSSSLQFLLISLFHIIL
jgi:hypothetical protein